MSALRTLLQHDSLLRIGQSRPLDDIIDSSSAADTYLIVIQCTDLDAGRDRFVGWRRSSVVVHGGRLGVELWGRLAYSSNEIRTVRSHPLGIVELRRTINLK